LPMRTPASRKPMIVTRPAAAIARTGPGAVSVPVTHTIRRATGPKASEAADTTAGFRTAYTQCPPGAQVRAGSCRRGVGRFASGGEVAHRPRRSRAFPAAPGDCTPVRAREVVVHHDPAASRAPGIEPRLSAPAGQAGSDARSTSVASGVPWSRAWLCSPGGRQPAEAIRTRRADHGEHGEGSA